MSAGPRAAAGTTPGEESVTGLLRAAGARDLPAPARRSSGRRGAALEDRAHFFAVAARVMRRLLIDHARARRSAKRGGARALPLARPWLYRRLVGGAR
jgi:hypothetical protein